MPAIKTAKGKTKSRSRTKSKGERKSKAERTEINQRNAKRSTGPRTAEGKRCSKHNAVTHGMTARSPLLPGEDATELLARQRALRDDMQPRNRLEAELLDRIGARLVPGLIAPSSPAMRGPPTASGTRHANRPRRKQPRRSSWVNASCGNWLRRFPSMEIIPGTWTSHCWPMRTSIPNTPAGSCANSSGPSPAAIGCSTAGLS